MHAYSLCGLLLRIAYACKLMCGFSNTNYSLKINEYFFSFCSHSYRAS